MKYFLTILFLISIAQAQTPNARCASPQKVNKDSINYYNLSGYIYPLGLLVDGNTATMPVPTSGEKYSDYYNRTKGWRWDFDLRQSYYITDIRIYWGTSNSDTLKTWISDSVFNGGPTAFARLRNVNSTTWDITSYSPGSAGWVDIAVNDSSRYIRFQEKNGWFGSNPLPTDGVREIEVYGCRIGSPAPIYAVKKAPKTLASKNGTNIAAEIHPVSLFTKQKYVRSYMERDYMDNQNVAYPANQYRYALFGGNPYTFNDSVKNKSGIFFWPSILGSNQYVITTGGKPMEYLALDAVGDDPENPTSYERAADFAWHVGHLWGNNPLAALDTSYSKVYDYVSITGGPKPYANNTISAYEGDNERNGWWKWFGIQIGPIADVAKASAEKDGDQGRLPDRLGGTRMGVKIGDPGLAFIMDGTAGIDVETIKARCYLSLMLRGEVMWDWIQGHEYFSLYDGKTTFTSNGQIGNKGTYPEDDSARIKYDDLTSWVYRIKGDTNVKIFTGEHGKDATFRYPLDGPEVDANITQFGATQYVDGTALDSLQAQAIDIEADKIAIWRSGFDAGVQYLFHDLEVQGVYGYSAAYVASGYVLHDLSKKPSNYREISQINLTEGYVLDSTLSEVNGGLIHYRGHKIGAPDSIVNVIRKAAISTGAGISVSINVHNATAATLRQASYTSENFTSSGASVSGGIIPATATVIPKYYFSYEPAGTPAASFLQRRRKTALSP